MPTPDPDSQLASILTWAQASVAYQTASQAAIAQLQAAVNAQNSPTPPDTAADDVETAIANVLAVTSANPVPPTPVAVTNPGAATASTPQSPNSPASVAATNLGPVDPTSPNAPTPTAAATPQSTAVTQSTGASQS
jgi:hypothetical protein